MNSIQYIVIDGNIGSGKTYILDILRKHYNNNLVIVDEPVANWTLLDSYYEDRQKYATAFQREVILSHYSALKDGVDKALRLGVNLIVSERSMVTTSVFIELNYDDGYITDDDKTMLYDLIKERGSGLPLPSSILIMNTDVDICYDRIWSRGRQCEVGIELTYLMKLRAKFDNLVVSTSATYVSQDRAIAIIRGHMGSIGCLDTIKAWYYSF